MMPTTSSLTALSEIISHARGDDMARFVRDCLSDAADAKSLSLSEIIARRSTSYGLSNDSTRLSMGSVFDFLQALGPDASNGTVLATLFARALVVDPVQGVEAEDAVSRRIAWLSADAGVDVLGVLDEVLGAKALGIWGALLEQVQRYDAGKPGMDRVQATIAAASIGASTNAEIAQRRVQVSQGMKSSLLARLLRGAGADVATDLAGPLVGEVWSAPRGTAVTFLLGACGYLFVAHFARIVARFALQHRRRAEVHVTSKGVVVRMHTSLFGRKVRESESLIPIDSIVKAWREVRFPRTGAYAGLLSLAIGSYLGVSYFIDGIRSMSISLVAAGLLITALGVALDFVLMSLLPGKKGTCRIVLVPKRGASTCVGWVDVAKADLALSALARCVRSSSGK